MWFYLNIKEENFLKVLLKWDFCISTIKNKTWLSDNEITDLEEKFVRDWFIKKHSIMWINQKEKEKGQTPYRLKIGWKDILYKNRSFYKRMEFWTVVWVFLTALLTLLWLYIK